MDVVMPQLGETVGEGTITVWRKKVGDTVSADEVLFEDSTDKVDTEIPAPTAGVLTEIVVAEGETVGVGTRLAVIDDGRGDAKTEAPAAEPAAPPAGADEGGDMAAVLSPVVSRLIAEHGLNVSDITGTGRGGRITRRDVLAHVEAGSGAAVPSVADGDEVIPFSRVNKLTAQHMVRSKATSAHVLQAVEVDFSAVEAARDGSALTYLPFIACAVCRAIAAFPKINASVVKYGTGGDALVVHRAVNLGIAVDLDFSALVVPVIRDAQDRSVAELADAIRALADRARGDGLIPDDMTGGTYTITNNGSFGTLITAPIINQPQVAVLSVDGIARRPVVVTGADGGEEIAIRPVGILAQSFDHRAFGGAYSGAYLNRLKQIIETTDWVAELG